MKWLFLVHQVQTPNSRERVKVWRSTKKVGAILYRNSVYVLPYSKERVEDFHWLSQRIRDSQGEASVFVSESTDSDENGRLQALFNNARESDYKILLVAADSLRSRIERSSGGKQHAASTERSIAKEFASLEMTLQETEKTDFFNHPMKGKVKLMLDRIKRQLLQDDGGQSPADMPALHDRKKFQGKVWATREHIHIDRLCSAWLIKKFIDPKAKFVFAPESKIPPKAIPFDIFGAEFSHHGDDCTFETLLKSFRISDKALGSMAQIVHDIDMKDGKFARSEAPGIDAIVRALSDSMANDHKTLDVGSILLDSLYEGLQN